MNFEFRFFKNVSVISSTARNLIIFAVTFLFISCKNEKKDKNLEGKIVEEEIIKNDSINPWSISGSDAVDLFDNKKTDSLFSYKINFNESPVNIKELILNDKEYNITSSMIDEKYLDSDFCNYKNYHLYRSYNIINKVGESSKNQLNVYVNDDSKKWNREDAVEEFGEILVSDSTFKLWGEINIGMKENLLVQLINKEEYHREKNIIKLYSQVFESSFFLKRGLVDSIKVSRRCLLDNNESYYSKYFIPNKLDSKYLISNQVTPNYFIVDFNGDENEDIAFVIRNVNNNKVGLIFFHSLNEFYIVGAGNRSSVLDNITYNQFSIDKNNIAYQTKIDSITGDVIDPTKIELENLSLIMGEDEGSSGLLTWKGSSYIYIHTGD